MDLLSMAQVVDEGLFCSQCSRKDADDCPDKCNEYLTGKKRGKKNDEYTRIGINDLCAKG